MRLISAISASTSFPKSFSTDQSYAEENDEKNNVEKNEKSLLITKRNT